MMRGKIVGVVGVVSVAGFLGFLLIRSGGTPVFDPLMEVGNVNSALEERGDQTPIDLSGIDEIFDEKDDKAGFTTKQFIDAYQQSLSNNDTYLKYNLAQTLYKKYGEKKLIPTLIALSLQHHDIQKAFEYLLEADLMGNEVHKTIGTKRIIYILFNASTQTPENLVFLKEIVTRFHQGGYLSDAQRDLYYGFIALLKGDITNYKVFINKLDGTDEQEWYDSFQSNLRKFSQYEYVPDYYLDGLEGITFFYQGRYTLAEFQGRKLQSFDEKYVLGYQLRAYAFIMLNEWDKAFEVLELLQGIQKDELYTLLQASSLYNQGLFADAILLLKQISENDYKLDAKRYQFLSYAGLGDTRGMITSIQDLLGHELTPYDYFSIFDRLLFAEKYEFTIAQKRLIETFFDQCNHDLGNMHGYVCLYGKAGIFIINGETNKAVSVLEGLVRWYPTSEVYERLATQYIALGDIGEAKKAYGKALSLSVDHDREQIIRKRIVTMFSEKK